MTASLLQIGITVVLAVAHVTVVVSLLVRERRQPSSTMAWILTLTFLPVIGLLAYWMFGRVRAQRLSDAYSKSAEAITLLEERLGLGAGPDDMLGEEADERTMHVLQLTQRLSSTPLRRRNDVQLLVDGAATYASVLKAIRAARKHIHIESYIIQSDEVGRALRDELAARAREGVEVRLVCDGLGSVWVPQGFWSKLRDAGGEVAVFRPVGPLLKRVPWRDRFDFRNHRKLVIIDGTIGFTGGINVGREYLGRDPDIGPWRDTGVRIEGPAVHGLQRAFAADWLHASGKQIDRETYFPPPVIHDDGCAVQVIDSFPMQTHSPISYLFTLCFHLARERIWLSTPYFIPEPPLNEALLTAALRGVDVRLLVPLKADHRVVGLASASYFPVLLEAGVRIYRYEPGFMHAKMLVIDDWACAVGSANMDIRSFHLNYELSAFMFGAEFCHRVASQFEKDFAQSIERTLDDEQEVRLPLRLVRAGARLLSPLL